MSRQRARQARHHAGLAILLAAVGGFVDSVGYLTLFDLFTSHQSGNSVLMGISLGRHDWAESVRRGFPIALFIFGLALGAVLGKMFARNGVRSTLAAPLAVEIGLLLLYLAFGSLAIRDGVLQSTVPQVFYPLAALPALAMGLQNTTVRKVGGLGVRTTFVSGMISSLAEETINYLFWLHDRRRRRPLLLLLRLSPRQPSFNHAFVLLSIWIGFVLGAVAGAVGKQQWDLFCLAAPAGVLTCIVVRDLLRPLAPA